MSKNAMAGAITLCGVGLCMIGGAMMMQNGQQANAATAVSMPVTAAAVAATATAQAGGEPTVVWMGVSENSGLGTWTYHRLWSDGRLETRSIGQSSSADDGCWRSDPGCSARPWIEVPPTPNGFACRTDINGDRIVDGSDLTFLLAAWGQEGGCEPEATYPCLSLGNLAGGAATE